MKVKIFLTLDVDPNTYCVPSDQNVAEEIKESLQEYLYDIDGVYILNIKSLQE